MGPACSRLGAQHDEAGSKTSEQLVGSINRRRTGPRSQARNVHKRVGEYAGKLRAARSQ